MRLLTTTILLACATSNLAAMQPTQKQIVQYGPDYGLPFSPAVAAGDFIYLSGRLAVDANGRFIGDDVGTQTRHILDEMAGVLKAAGAGMDRAAAVTVYLKRGSDFAAMNEVYRTFWPQDPPTRTTVVADLLFPEALVEISMVAIRPGAERTVIHPPDWLRSPAPYSYGIKSGNTLFLAGLVSRSGRDNSVVEGDVRAQTRTIMDNAGDILKAAGMSHSDVVSSRVYITDGATFQDMNSVYRTYFPENPPARATVIADLMSPQYGVEITMLAVKGPREVVTTPAADGSPGRVNPVLSSAIRSGNTLYVSGMLGNTPANRGDARAQTAETLARIQRTLEAAGFNWSHVVDGVVYLTDLRNYAAMNEAYRAVISKDFPARATVGTGLVVPDGLVEIMVTAVK